MIAHQFDYVLLYKNQSAETKLYKFFFVQLFLIGLSCTCNIFVQPSVTFGSER
ncbi:transcriptional regulator, partial [Vibrio parahaemolyticus]